MSDEQQPPPRYTRYRTRPRLLPGPPPAEPGAGQPPQPDREGWRRGRRRERARRGERIALSQSRGRAQRFVEWWRRMTIKRALLTLLGLIVGWLLLSLVLFLISSHFERTSPPSNVAAVLDPAGFPLTSVNNILVLGSDRRPKGSKEPGANTSGPSRSDSILLLRIGGGHNARLSIPRDTVIPIAGHGEQKINAAYAFGGPALSISVIKHYLDIPINHLVEVNFEDFPQLIDAMGGVDYTGGCIVSRVDGGFSNGGFTLRLPKGTHRIDGKQALALARTRENLCHPNETDLQREEHQQALFTDMKNRLLSVSSFFRLPLIAWNAPTTIISDMSGPTLIGLFGALATSGTPPTRVLKPSGSVTLPDGELGLHVSESARRAAVARFMGG
ncbi:MAG TPA: LCP family protein [Solirubrobacteraceae bacterium]|jgi:LCP family protein required for cell wall assembly|nr:LCP family protein [Solirubrobacteraceae bacterium]